MLKLAIGEYFKQVFQLYSRTINIMHSREQKQNKNDKE